MRFIIPIYFFIVSVSASTWPQWRGEYRTGEVRGAWPESIKDALRLQWTVPLGKGYATPIVSSNKVVTFSSVGNEFEMLQAWDRESGKALWELKWKDSMNVPFFAAKNGNWVRSTPVLDGGRIYAGGMRDVLVCADLETGKELWRIDFKERYDSPNPSFGLVCSPIIDGDFLYIQAGGGVVKINKLTGESVWRGLHDGGGMYGSAFSSPVIAELQGQRQLLVQTRTTLASLNLESGEVLWKQDIEAFRGMNILTPLVWGNRVFTSAYGGRSHCFEITKPEASWAVTEVWNNKLQGYMTSPVLIGGHIYFLLRNKRFACIRAEDGEIAYISDRAGSEYISLCWKDDRLLGLDSDGRLHLIQATPESFSILESVTVSPTKNTWAHLAIADDQLFVRAIDGLHVYTWGASAGQSE